MKLIPVRMDKAEKPPYTKLRSSEAVQMSKAEARKLVMEIQTMLSHGRPAEDLPTIEKLAKLLQMEIDL